MTYPKKTFIKDVIFIAIVIAVTYGLCAIVDDTEGSIWTKNKMECME